MLEDPAPNDNYKFNNRIADIEWQFFQRSLQSLPTCLPYETIEKGSLAYLTAGKKTRLIEDPSEKYRPALITLCTAVQSELVDQISEEAVPLKLSFLFNKEFLLFQPDEQSVAILFRLRDSTGTEYLQTPDGLYPVQGHSTLLVASASADDPENFCIDNHLTLQAYNDLLDPFVDCLQTEFQDAWRHSFIGSMLLESFSDSVSAAAQMPVPGLLVRDRHKLLLSLDTEHGAIQAQVFHNHRFQMLSFNFAREVKSS